MNISHSDRTAVRRGRARRSSPAARRVLAGALLVSAAGIAGAAAGPAALAAPLSPAASASPAASPPGGGTISWSISTATASAADFRAKYSYTNIKPGSTITDHFAVFNHGSEAVAFELYGTDATGTTSSNVLIFLPATATPVDIGSWVFFPRHVSRLSIIIPADRGEILPFTIAVPHNASPGDHVGAVMAQVSFQRTTKTGQVVTESQRIGAPIFLRVAGALHAGLAVESVSATFHGTLSPVADGSSTVAFTVHNTGNILLSGSQRVTVSGPFGSAIIRLKSLPTLLPGDSVRITGQSAATLYPAGPFTADVRVGPAVPPGQPQLAKPMAQVSASASTFATPWGLILLIVVVAAIIVGVVQLTRFRRRRLQATIGAVADQVRRETERRLLGSKSSATEPQGKA
jgi:hypothetical protein